MGNTRTAAALAALVAANLLPLWFLRSGWHAYDVALLFWWENVVLGTYAVFRIVLAYDARDDWFEGGPWRLLYAGAFVATFAVYCSAVLELVWRVFPEIAGQLASGHVASTTIAGLLIAHGLAYAFDYVMGGEYRQARAFREMAWPYARLVGTQALLIAGAALVHHAGDAVLLIVALLVAKALLDCALYLLVRWWW